jgi:hypothetical protein
MYGKPRTRTRSTAQLASHHPRLGAARRILRTRRMVNFIHVEHFTMLYEPVLKCPAPNCTCIPLAVICCMFQYVLRNSPCACGVTVTHRDSTQIHRVGPRFELHGLFKGPPRHMTSRYGADTEHDLALQEVFRSAIAHTIIEDPEAGPAAPATVAAVASSEVTAGSRLPVRQQHNPHHWQPPLPVPAALPAPPQTGPPHTAPPRRHRRPCRGVNPPRFQRSVAPHKVVLKMAQIAQALDTRRFCRRRGTRPVIERLRSLSLKGPTGKFDDFSQKRRKRFLRSIEAVFNKSDYM